MKNLTVRQIAFSALVGALYVALCYFGNIFGLNFGIFQCRFAEALTVLPFLCPATTSMKSVLFSPDSRLLKSRSTASVKDVTGMPVCVVRSSGVRTRRPIMVMLFNILVVSSRQSSLQTIMGRRIPSVIPNTRSSSLGNSGLLVKDMRT